MGDGGFAPFGGGIFALLLKRRRLPPDWLR